MIIAATARLMANPEQIPYDAGAVSMRGGFNGWTLAELAAQPLEEAGRLMLLREPAVLRTGGGLDSNGDPIPYEDNPIRAEFAPLTAEESYATGRNPSSVTYRMTFLWPAVLPAATAVSWRAKLYSFVGPSMMCTVAGRLHHQEAIVTRATG